MRLAVSVFVAVFLVSAVLGVIIIHSTMSSGWNRILCTVAWIGFSQWAGSSIGRTIWRQQFVCNEPGNDAGV